jgi:hypothetical protein
MKKLIQICFALCLVSSAIAQASTGKVLRVYDWNDLMSQHPFPNSEIVSMDGMSVLKIEKTNDAPLDVSLLTITNASMIRKIDSISFDVKYDIHGERSFVRTNHFGAVMRGKYLLPGTFILFSHYPPDTQGGDENTNSGTYDIAGTSNWKPYSWDVSSYNDSLPTKLELALSLPATGTVYLRPIKIFTQRTSWLSPQMGVLIGVVGGICGAGIGCFGALIGCLVGLGKARRFVLAMVKIFIGLGILLMIAGIFAAATQQPWPVWYSMLLMGVVLTILFSVNLYPIKRRYEELEIRRMTSMDATGH